MAKHKGQLVGYVRVSTLDQHTERQLEGMKLVKIFTDKASGKDTKRPQLQAALEYLRESDTLIVHSMDRLGRNMLDLLQTIKTLNDRGVAVQFMKEHLTFSGADSPRGGPYPASVSRSQRTVFLASCFPFIQLRED